MKKSDTDQLKKSTLINSHYIYGHWSLTKNKRYRERGLASFNVSLQRGHIFSISGNQHCVDLRNGLKLLFADTLTAGRSHHGLKSVTGRWYWYIWSQRPFLGFVAGGWYAAYCGILWYTVGGMLGNGANIRPLMAASSIRWPMIQPGEALTDKNSKHLQILHIGKGQNSFKRCLFCSEIFPFFVPTLFKVSGVRWCYCDVQLSQVSFNNQDSLN